MKIYRKCECGNGYIEITTVSDKANLVKGQDNCIFIQKDSFTESWKILRTKEKGSSASVMFLVETEGQAMNAGQKVAEAIGIKFFGKVDPRK